MVVHRMHICIEVPAIDPVEHPASARAFPRVSLVSFADMMSYIQALMERTKEDAKGEIANARFSYSTEWNVDPELGEKTS
jgi:hypothetical protein